MVVQATCELYHSTYMLHLCYIPTYFALQVPTCNQLAQLLSGDFIAPPPVLGMRRVQLHTVQTKVVPTGTYTRMSEHVYRRSIRCNKRLTSGSVTRH